MFEEYKWYIVHTTTNCEDKVAENIIRAAENRNMRDQIVDVFIPKYTEKATVEKKDKNGNVKSVETKEIVHKKEPGYVYVKLAVAYDEKAQEVKMTNEAWYLVRNTRFVTGFVGPDGTPKALTPKEVINLGVEVETVTVGYEVGDLVTVIGGSFDGFSGVVDNIDIENDTVRVIISMMGRDTPLELGLDQVVSAVD